MGSRRPQARAPESSCWDRAGSLPRSARGRRGSNLYSRLAQARVVVPLVPGLLVLVPGAVGFRSFGVAHRPRRDLRRGHLGSRCCSSRSRSSRPRRRTSWCRRAARVRWERRRRGRIGVCFASLRTGRSTPGERHVRIQILFARPVVPPALAAPLCRGHGRPPTRRSRSLRASHSHRGSRDRQGHAGRAGRKIVAVGASGSVRVPAGARIDRRRRQGHHAGLVDTHSPHRRHRRGRPERRRSSRTRDATTRSTRATRFHRAPGRRPDHDERHARLGPPAQRARRST